MAGILISLGPQINNMHEVAQINHSGDALYSYVCHFAVSTHFIVTSLHCIKVAHGLSQCNQVDYMWLAAQVYARVHDLQVERAWLGL